MLMPADIVSKEVAAGVATFYLDHFEDMAASSIESQLSASLSTYS